jgi:hypothetical protein
MYALLNIDLTHVTTAKQIVFYFSYKGGTVVVVIEFTTALTGLLGNWYAR